GIETGGKTGTAQNPHGKDDSIFIMFAPFDHPKIAVAVMVENAGFGASTAGPIASLMVEKYLTGKIADTPKRQWVLQRALNARSQYLPEWRDVAAASTD
ncbi:MAG TPA: penicillin-binding transpeptidase domain-containing protein, partial [Rhodothermales bacterium]|nr:penicillin-binding transpeptidase domain-containing protein [Rhodothermales bacterium]